MFLSIYIRTLVLSKILVSGDGSKNPFRALDHAIYIANKVSVHITAINIMENPAKVYVKSQKLLDEILANFKEDATNTLDQFRNEAAKSSVRIETVI
jgi:DNA polymerase III sliding clamp (beta) subunit (PCNA family)